MNVTNHTKGKVTVQWMGGKDKCFYHVYHVSHVQYCVMFCQLMWIEFTVVQHCLVVSDVEADAADVVADGSHMFSVYPTVMDIPPLKSCSFRVSFKPVSGRHSLIPTLGSLNNCLAASQWRVCN